jgi:hypothetical protein
LIELLLDLKLALDAGDKCFIDFRCHPTESTSYALCFFPNVEFAFGVPHFNPLLLESRVCFDTNSYLAQATGSGVVTASVDVTHL